MNSQEAVLRHNYTVKGQCSHTQSELDVFQIAILEIAHAVYLSGHRGLCATREVREFHRKACEGLPGSEGILRQL